MKSRHIKTLCWSSVALAAMLWSVTFAQQRTPVGPPAAPPVADEDPSGRVARLNFVQGSVSFQPAGEPDWVSAFVNRPITTGDRLWADNGSRAEMHLGTSTIRLDAMTGMSFFNLDDRTTQVELSEGVLNIRVQRLDRDEIFEVDTPNQAFSILRAGLYRIQASEDGTSTMVTVRSGEGEVTGGGRIYSVGSGLTGNFTGTDTLRASIYTAGGVDEFDNWCSARDRHDDGVQAVRYVSPEVVGYQDLDDYGYWQVDPAYGNIWIPRVATGWAPYHDGRWVWISPWGWTWVDDAPWGYAPFHYGRWVNVRNNWGWIPGPIAVRPVYAPALVVFIGGPRFSISVGVGGGGNVGWFPLGPREVYVPAYRTSRAYVDRVNVSNTVVNNVTITNVYNNTNNTNITYVNRTARGGVTAVSQTTFINAQPVGRSVVAVTPQEIASAPVNRRAEVVPTRNSVFGASASGGNRVSQPPAAVVNRTVVAKTPPPPPPVAFEKQQARLAAHPGQPLARNEVEVLRPANAPAVPARVKQAPPGRAAVADSNQPANNAPPVRGGGNRGPQQPVTPQPPAAAPVPVPAGGNPAVNNAPPVRGGGNRGPQQPVTPQQPPAAPVPAVVNPPASNTPAIRNDRPPVRGGRGNQSAPPQPAAPATPAQAAPASPPANNAPPVRGGRGNQPAPPQPATPAAPAQAAPASPPANNAPPVRGGRGNQPAPPQPAAPAAPAQTPPANPPANSTPPGRGGNRGQQAAPAPTPEATPTTVVPSPASRNAPGGRGRGQ